MRAAVFESAGSPLELLRLIDVDVPVPRGHETLVKVDASPIQPSDLMFIEGRYRIRPVFPQVAGLEGTGIVTVVGPDARIPVQTRVAFRHPGAWAEFALVPDDRLYIVPDGIPVESAAQFSLNPVTAWAILDELGVRAGDWIAVNAATSSIARLVQGLCRGRRVSVLGIVGPGREAPRDFPVVPDAGVSLSERVRPRPAALRSPGCSTALAEARSPACRTRFGPEPRS